MTRVAAFGALGKMGRTVCQAVTDDADTELAAAIDLAASGETVCGVTVSADAQDAVAAQVQVMVDFTVAATARETIAFCLNNGIHCVVGTTGFSDDDLRVFERAAESGGANIFIAPNFSIGAVLMMRFAEQAARYFGSAEVIELHHNQKVDAPSGTALKTARGIADSWMKQGRPAGGEPAPGEHEVIPGARGGDVGGVRVHSVRGQGLIAHQEVVFGGPGQTLTIRHDAPERISYMPGVLLAVKAVAGLPSRLTIGLEHLLEV